MLKRFSFWLWVVIVLQLLTAIFHSLSLFITPDPNTLPATERQILELMTTYRMDMGAGFHRTTGELFKALSSCFSLLYLLAALINLYLLKKRVDAGLIKGLVGIQIFVLGICFGVMALLTFLPPIVLTGLVFVFLAVTFFLTPRESLSNE
jgi:hypothetical protein